MDLRGFGRHTVDQVGSLSMLMLVPPDWFRVHLGDSSMDGGVCGILLEGELASPVLGCSVQVSDVDPW